MADRGDTHYHVPNLNRWFALSSILLLVTTVWMVIDDWNAPWKKYQREFRDLEVARAEEVLASPEYQAAAQEEERLRDELQRAMGKQEERKAEIRKLEEELVQVGARRFVATERAKKLKQELNFQVFLIEEHRIHHGDRSYRESDLRGLQIALTDAEGEKERAEIRTAEVEGRLAAMRSVVAEAEGRLKGATKDLELVRRRLARLRPERLSEKLADVIRDAPGLDFIDPNLKVRKVVLADLTNNLNFTTKQRIDMCHTCHMAIDREEYSGDVPQPFRAHPRLDLYLSAKSPHPMAEVGCTICHRGAGEALDFIRADHRPLSDPSLPMGGGQWAEWKEEHHWHKQHHWDWPMLTSDYVEASCVQCHKTSMELIAKDAPKVSEGYRLFERYGCYSCHKVDWFPTERRPGPTLANWKSKLTADWMASWVAHPRSFRPSTWMPQIFHLENFGADQVVVTSEHGRGRDILGQEWNDSAVASVVAFLEERVPERPLDPIPVEGDAQRGREVFRVAGCLACHNLAPYEGEEPKTRDLAHELSGENQKGPNLRGVATKINAEWLYHWVRDPHAYWDQTLMPNLRLSEQDAADVTAYLMQDPDGVFTDVPDDWKVEPARFDVEVLREQARWFYRRDGRDVVEARFRGEVPSHRWDDPKALLAAVGEKFVGHQGCYSCHEIPGMESVMPIGVELTSWGSKTVDKLDWGMVADLMAQKHGWSLMEREEYKGFREHWLEQKLDRPRSFDLEKVKNPLDRLRMPWFGFERSQIDAIATFVVGLVEDEVQRAKMVPTPAQVAMNHGMQAVRQKNCAACHVIGEGSLTFLREGEPVQVKAELLPLGGGEDPLPPSQHSLDDLRRAILAYEEEYGEEVEEVGFRLLRTEPGVGLVGQNVFVPLDEIVAVEPADGGDFVRLVTDYYIRGIELHDAQADDPEEALYAWNLGENGEVEDVDGQLRAYFEEAYPKIRWTFAPPVLLDEGHKLQREWFHAFLKDPEPLRRQMRVKMPTFRYAPGEAEAIADYFAHKSEKEWPTRYAKSLRYALGMKLKPSFQGPGLPWPEAATQAEGGEGLSVAELVELAARHPATASLRESTIEAIESGSAPDIAASFDKLLRLGELSGFRMNGPVDARSQWVRRRAPSHLAARAHLIAMGAALATKADAVNCYQCHWHAGEPPQQEGTPIAWAPDLVRARERLREDWVEEWLWNPGWIYPGTAMPANFTGDPPQFQNAYPDSTNSQQIQAVLDWLFNFDRTESLGRN